MPVLFIETVVRTIKIGADEIGEVYAMLLAIGFELREHEALGVTIGASEPCGAPSQRSSSRIGFGT